jgi:hypothetical protein
MELRGSILAPDLARELDDLVAEAVDFSDIKIERRQSAKGTGSGGCNVWGYVRSPATLAEHSISSSLV